MRLQVDQADISAAIEGDDYQDSYRCPIARALRRKFPDAFISVEGDGRVLIARVDTGSAWFTLSSRGRYFMSCFDSLEEVGPSRFTLTPLKEGK